MTKPDFSNPDSSMTPHSSGDDLDAGVSREDQGLAFSESAPEAEAPKSKKNLELFPMPGLTMSREDAMDLISDASQDSEMPDEYLFEDVASSDTGVSVPPSPYPTPLDSVPEKEQNLASEEANTENVVESTNASFLESGVARPIKSTDNDSDHAIESDDQSATILAATSADVENAPKQKKASVFERLGQKVSDNPVVSRVFAFAGWPWAIALSLSGATTMGAFAWLASLPPVPNCKAPSSSWTAASRLYCADQAARKKEPQALASALEMVGDWDKNDPLFDQVNKLSNDWSRSILDVAEKELDQGKLNEAIKLAEKVPQSSSYYDESRATIKDWQTNWKDGEKILEVARDAIQEQDWAVATDQMRQLVQLGGEHWQRRADKLISEMTIEQDAFRKLNVANDRAAAGTVPEIESAILLATQIDPKRLARKKLVTYVDRWSEKLIDLADYHYEVGNFDTAIEAAEAVPPGSKVGEQAIAYLNASRAQAASQEENPLGYLQAVTYAAQIPESAEVRSESEADIEGWEQQVQSWAQLEFAKVFTRIDQKAGYEIAMDHAALVDAESPNRIQAQSLIAQWDKQSTSVADRQTIARAAQLAQKTDLASVNAAIAEARRVTIESPLRVRAQTLIAEWEGSIEKREDQPIMDRANALAKKGDLYAAIDMAETIDSNRALYDEAQDAIYGWVSDIQIAEDDPILNAAAALANQGRYSEAIAKASEVRSGRALYYEAQDLIGGWIAERNRIEAARRPPEPEPYYEEEQYYEPEEQYVEPQTDNFVNSAPAPAEPYQEEYVDSASGAGVSGGPAF